MSRTRASFQVKLYFEFLKQTSVIAVWGRTILIAYISCSFVGSSMARKWFLSEVWTAFLLEYKANVGHKDNRVETGEMPDFSA